MNASRLASLALFSAAPLMASCVRDAADATAEVAVVVPATNFANSARWSSDGKRLAYNRTVEGKSGIWVSNADGSNPVRLTNGVWDYLPNWSPDGKWIAYLAESPSFDVMVVSADGGEARQLTSDRALERPIGWLLDGSGVVYVKLGDAFETNVVMLSDGSSRPLVSADGNVEAQLSPDGKRVAYELAKDGKTTIWLWDSSTNEHRQLTFEGREGMDEGLAWSPDGASLLFRSARTGTPDLWIADVASGQLRQLTTDVQPDFDGRWSPDGRWVAFVSSRGGQSDVWIVPAAGGDALRVTDDLAIEQFLTWTPDGRGLTFGSSTNVPQVRIVPIEGGEPRLVSFADYPAFDARVSPDGASILFVSTRSGNNDIWVVPAAGGDPRPLTTSALSDGQPDWSPDGKSIAFSSNRRGSSDIFVMSDTGGEARLLTDWPATGEGGPRFSPDGRTIAFTSNREARTSDVWIVPAEGGTPTRVTRLDAFTLLQDWSGDGRFLLVKTGASDGALYRVPASGGKVERVSAPLGANMARWSPDGGQIAYADIIGGYSYLTVGQTTGGQPTRLTTEERSYDLSPRWSPDGKHLAYDSYDLPNSTEDIVVANVADRTTRKVTSTPDLGETTPQWTPDGRSLVISYARRGSPIVTANVANLLDAATAAAVRK